MLFAYIRLLYKIRYKVTTITTTMVQQYQIQKKQRQNITCLINAHIQAFVLPKLSKINFKIHSILAT